MTGRPDFDVGDLVVCTNGGPCPVYGQMNCRKGSVYSVTLLSKARDVSGTMHWAIRMDRDNPEAGRGYNAAFFRKVEPLPEALTSLLVSNPVRDRVPA